MAFRPFQFVRNDPTWGTTLHTKNGVLKRPSGPSMPQYLIPPPNGAGNTSEAFVLVWNGSEWVWAKLQYACNTVVTNVTVASVSTCTCECNCDGGGGGGGEGGGYWVDPDGIPDSGDEYWVPDGGGTGSGCTCSVTTTSTPTLTKTKVHGFAPVNTSGENCGSWAYSGTYPAT